MLRKLTWAVLVTSGIGGVLWALIASEPKHALAIAIVSIVVWIVFGSTLQHFRGIRRRVLKHFGRGWRETDAQVVTHSFSSNDRANVQIALDKLRLQRDPPTPLLGYPARAHGTLTALVK